MLRAVCGRALSWMSKILFQNMPRCLFCIARRSFLSVSQYRGALTVCPRALKYNSKTLCQSQNTVHINLRHMVSGLAFVCFGDDVCCHFIDCCLDSGHGKKKKHFKFSLNYFLLEKFWLSLKIWTYLTQIGQFVNFFGPQLFDKSFSGNHTRYV